MISSTDILDWLQPDNTGVIEYFHLLPVELQNNLRNRRSAVLAAALSPRTREKRDDKLVVNVKAALGEESYLQLIDIITAQRALQDSENPNDENYNLSHEQNADQNTNVNGTFETTELPMAEAVSKHQCCYCIERRASQLVLCSQCGDIYCLYDWPKERRHDAGNPISSLHHQINLSIHDWVEATLNANVHPAEQQRLHCEDMSSLWFGLNIEDESTDAKFINTDVYGDIIAASMYPDKAQQFPSLVSFVGPTGAGKSTLIKGLITLDRGQERLPTPVPGNEQNLGNPTSGDVHLYADPTTLDDMNPMLFVDCEGLDGGNNTPGAIRSRTGLGIRTMLREAWRTMKNRDFYFPNPEGFEGGKPTRRFCVEDLYPRMIYAFSDVICFVTERANTAEVTIERLIKWADKVLTKTVNQPSLPRAIIIANGMKNNPTSWLDEDFATNAMLNDTRNMRLIDPEIRLIKQSWRNKLPNGRRLESLYDLLQLYFEDICVVYIPLKLGHAPDIIYEQYQKLRRRIETECEKIQTKKDQSWNRLNTTELSRFFNGAFDHFSHNFNEPFDFFKFSRQNNPLPVAFDQHASNLMRKMQQDNRNIINLDTRVGTILASCISLGTLEAETFRFPPERIVGEYQELCESAYTQYYESAPCAYTENGKRCVNIRNSHGKGHQDSSGEIFDQGDYVMPYTATTQRSFWDTISASYTQRALELRHLKNSTEDYAAEVIARHQEVLLNEKDFWKSAISHVTCFICLVHHPDNVLPCGHAICENCIKRFGIQDEDEIAVFQLPKCPLCQRDLIFQRAPWEIQLKPENSGVRVLCLDGGGIRGVISCKILELLEDEIGLGIPIHEFFDLIVGTSTGGIIALGLGRNLWSAQTCLESFKKLAKNAFRRHAGADLPLIGWIVAYWMDSFYRTPDLEAQLQKAFQPKTEERLLFGDDFSGPFAASKQRSRALKVAVSATTTINPEAYLITNYNRKKNTDGIKIYREDNPNNEMDVWEAARCTSAAPTIFQAYEAKNGRCFQDGGLKHNNPVKIATAETNLLWPCSSQLDYLVTIGTGYTNRPAGSPDIPEVVPSFLRRLLKNFNDSFDTEIIWREHKPSIDPSQLLTRYHRFNLWQPSGTLPDLDNVSRINDLEIATNEAFYHGKPMRLELKKTANALLAGLFYMNIETISRASEHSYYINAVIACRLEQRYHAKVVTELLMRNAYFHANIKKSEITSNVLDSVRRGGYFRILIDYTVTSLSEKIEIHLVLDSDTLQSRTGTRHHISGSPLSFERQHDLVSDSSFPLSQRSSMSPSPPGVYTPSVTETATSHD